MSKDNLLLQLITYITKIIPSTTLESTKTIEEDLKKILAIYEISELPWWKQDINWKNGIICWVSNEMPIYKKELTIILKKNF